MNGRRADPWCCGRCAGPEAVARAARRQRLRAAIFAGPGGGLLGAATGGRAGGAHDGQYRAVIGMLLDSSPHVLVVAGLRASSGWL